MRRQCEYPGCIRPGRNKGFYKGSIRYDKYCEKHHRMRYGKTAYYKNKQLISNDQCSNCGWNKGPCDRHRIKREDGYVDSNVIILCPNCHRLTHLGLL